MDVIGSLQSKIWSSHLAAALIVLISIYATSKAPQSWPLLHQLSRHSIAVLVAILLIAVILLCTALILVVPVWVAWLTDAKATAKLAPHSFLEPIDLTIPRQAMAAIHHSIRNEKPVFHQASEALNLAIDEILSFFSRDFVKAWHDPLLSGSPDCKSSPLSHFPNMVDITIRESLHILVKKLSHIDIPEFGMCQLLPTLTRHLKLFEEAEAQWRKSPSAAEFANGVEGDLFLAALYNKGVLHPAVGDLASPDTKLTELAHLQKLAEKTLKHILPESEAKSNGVQIVVRELIACTLMKPIIDAMSDPDTLNALLEEKAGAALQQQKLVRKLREALDRQGSTSITIETADSRSPKSSVQRRDMRSSESLFDSFMTSIGQSKSILDARRTKNGLIQQIRKTKTALATLAEDEGPTEPRKKSLQIYLQRLQAAMKAVDARISQLGKVPATVSQKGTPSQIADSSNHADSLELRDILISSSAISYFLEYSEARRCSILVQFWLAVNTFKNPLEVADSDSEDEITADSVGSPLHPSGFPSAHEDEAKTLFEDLTFFVETYYQSERLRKVVKSKYINVAKEYLQQYATDQISPTTRVVQSVRKSVLRAQKQVYDELVEEEWPRFRRSPAWYQVVEELHRERAEEAPTVTSSSSFFLESNKKTAKDVAPKPSTSRAVSHAQLFGMAGEEQEKSPATSLFAEEKDEHSIRLLSQTNSSLDQLLGGKGVTFEGLNGRTPLFREALFDDEEDIEAEKEEKQMTGKEVFVQVDKVDALENVLAFIIEEDLPLNQNRAERPNLGNERRSSTSVKSRHQLSLFDEDEEVADLEQAKVDFHGQVNLAWIDQEVQRLTEQQELLASLIRKSELTGSSDKEMQLLHKSSNTIARELREFRFQRRTATEQQSENHQEQEVEIKADRVRIQIQHAEVNHDIDGKEYATYLIEVSHLARPQSINEADNPIALSGWIVSRRYNEFYALHSRLKEMFEQVRALEAVFPGKRFNGLVNVAFLESRRVNLQRYLQRIVKIDAVCKSRELKRFLSQSVTYFTIDTSDVPTPISAISKSTKGLVSRLYRGMTGVAEGLDDLLFGPSMYEVIVQRLSLGVVDLMGFNEMERVLAGATTSSAAEIKEATQANNTLSFTGPLCDAIIELFQLKLEGNWFRKQAVIIVAQQALGGTIERRVRQSFSAAIQPSALIHSIAMIRDMIWPNGELKKPTEHRRSLEDKKLLKENALKKLSTLIPNVASHFIGRENARRAARTSWALLQNKRLNKHIIYTILDQILDEVFES